MIKHHYMCYLLYILFIVFTNAPVTYVCARFVVISPFYKKFVVPLGKIIGFKLKWKNGSK